MMKIRLLPLVFLSVCCGAASAFHSALRCSPAAARTATSLAASLLDANAEKEDDDDDGKPTRAAGTTSRRNVLLSGISAATTAAVVGSNSVNENINVMRKLIASPPDSAITTTTTTSAPLLSTVDDAIAWIDENCDRRFLHAVVASDYCFLYRGIGEEKQISVRKESPDLLLPGTYGKENAGDDEALVVFQKLEEILKDEPVRPSNGHLATTSAKDAAAWGTAASIWPIMSATLLAPRKGEGDTETHYAWFQTGGLFYPRNNNNGNRMLLDRSSIIVDGKDCGQDSLEDALKGQGWEIMVATSQYLAVPASMDAALRHGLRNSFLL